jgi:hypothetical protein
MVAKKDDKKMEKEKEEDSNKKERRASASYLGSKRINGYWIIYNYFHFRF